MGEKRTSLFDNGLIWFGAAVSIAEIITGTYFAPLGLAKGTLAIVLGHIIGCALLFFALLLSDLLTFIATGPFGLCGITSILIFALTK